jgi:glycosyltransferase involved in cell wall biosynthesis
VRAETHVEGSAGFYPVTVEPKVSIVVPARDEAVHIAACVRSILAQEVDVGFEMLVADDGSSDGTAGLARAAGATVLVGPGAGVSAAMNRGLAAARGSVIIRFDAHAEMPPGYVAACLRTLAEEPGAANVGGWMEAVGRTGWGRAVGAALASRFGVGHPLIWRRPSPTAARKDVDHVPLGCFRTSTLRRLGGWREDLLTNEDFELSYRLRLDGGRVIFDPEIWSIYRPRESLPAVAGQYWRYGRWKAAMLAASPRSLRPRQLAPPALVLIAAVALVPSPLARPSRAALGCYLAALGVVSARSGAGWRTAPVLATMHAAWGAGLLTGFVRAPSR